MPRSRNVAGRAVFRPLIALATDATTFVAVCSGIVCLVLPWERLPSFSLHVIPVVAGLEISAVIRATDPAGGVLFVLVAVFAAYAFASRAQIAGHLTLIGLFLVAPLLYDPGAHSSTIHHALLEFPTIVLVAGLVAYLHERAEAQEETLRRFAGEAIDIAAGMAGDPKPPKAAHAPSGAARLLLLVPPGPTLTRRPRRASEGDLAEEATVSVDA